MALAGLTVAAFFVFLPFLSSLIAAVLVTTVAHPLFTRVLSFVGSERRGIASGLTCALIVLLVFFPVVLCGWFVAQDAEDVIRELPDKISTFVDRVEHLPLLSDERDDTATLHLRRWWQHLLSVLPEQLKSQARQLQEDAKDVPVVVDVAGSPGRQLEDGDSTAESRTSVEPVGEAGAVDASPGESPQFPISAGGIANMAGWVTKVLTSLLAGVVGVVVKSMLMLFIMFYFFKDGPQILESVQRALAVDSSYQERVIQRFREVSVGMTRGVLLTALAQGTVAAIAFSFFEIKALFWGAVVALCALVPVVGTGLVTIPLTLYFLILGQYGYAAAAAVLAVLISSLDNLLRPLLLEGELKLHPVWILLAILGGVGCFGALGLILGPMVVVLLRTVLALVAEESQKRGLTGA